MKDDGHKINVRVIKKNIFTPIAKPKNGMGVDLTNETFREVIAIAEANDTTMPIVAARLIEIGLEAYKKGYKK